MGLPIAIAIGVMAASLLLSLALIGLDLAGIDFGLRQYEESLLRSIDFSNVLMQGMLSLLLFAGALHVDLSELRAYRWQVATARGAVHHAVHAGGGLRDLVRAVLGRA